MDADGEDGFENEEQFWLALDEISEAPYESHEHIDNALRSFLALTTLYKQTYLQSENDIARCCYKLLDSELYQANQTYARRQILYCLLQDDDIPVLHITAAMLLFDGRMNESAFEMLRSEGVFPRLIQLIRGGGEDNDDMRRLLLELLFELCRTQKLSREELITADDDFVLYLLQLIEDYSDDVDDPYHYPIIRVLLVLNEQYMCLASMPPSADEDGAIPNRIVTMLSAYGSSYRTFGENIILLLNRESTLSAQLLILKLLYLLFTSPSTYEYFYTNDLHVLVDVIIRKLLDLDPGSEENALETDGVERDGQRALRHTYLRVLCPLLRNTQLAKEGGHYKKEEVRRLLYLLVNKASQHFAPVDETVLKLVVRCKRIDWIREEGDEEDPEYTDTTPISASTVATQHLGMSLVEAGVSNLSVADVSAKVAKEKPAVPAPRRFGRKKRPDNAADAQTDSTNAKKQLQVPLLVIPSVDVQDRDGGRSPFSDDNREVD
ncbi:hypothetical protein BDY17DRAFT_174984 [Neohortaea acidophila]|uniref:SPIN90/Ldb17 leucine-rich domain-containing protein n=1 Tax=Neohortaea acidophila TaxID=245834 RepID=A0A6A6PPP0_9PEZI|nr:uncharacterized protein BDY17DRAFT_174984 [Neohortaea acidophila]KAF2481982.1 hypothetical protein BDY17DRAFT_174984 [Neohortaea acidophila]